MLDLGAKVLRWLEGILTLSPTLSLTPTPTPTPTLLTLTPTLTKVLRWLEGIAYAEKIQHGDVTVQERNPLARTLATLGAGRTQTHEDDEGHSVELVGVMAALGVPEPDAAFCQARP